MQAREQEPIGVSPQALGQRPRAFDSTSFCLVRCGQDFESKGGHYDPLCETGDRES